MTETELRNLVAKIEQRLERLEQDVENIVRALRAHAEDFHINLGETSRKVKGR